MARKRLKGKGHSKNTMIIEPLLSKISDRSESTRKEIPDIFSSGISFPKIRELRILGMKHEVVVELDHLRDRYMSMTSNTFEDLENLINIGKTYLDLEEYSKAISLADGYSKRDKRFSYFCIRSASGPF